MAAGCHQEQKENSVLNRQQNEQAIAELRAAYAAFNRGDIDAAVRVLDPQVEWVEPAEFPYGGAYHGIEGAKRYLAQSRAAAAQLISEPEAVPSRRRPSRCIRSRTSAPKRYCRMAGHQPRRRIHL